jgi:tRNA-2-methylthio-N6-dimethylallyladenosine synthase
MAPPKRIYVETYGCQMNVADTELILGLLDRDGYAAAESPEDADVILVNTCAIRDNAEQRVYGRVGELKRHKRTGGVLGVVGCMAQRLGADLLDAVSHIDLVVGPDGYRGLPELIHRAAAGERTVDVDFKSWEHYEDVPPVRSAQVSAFVTVQRGCNYRCTFCIVPMTRGSERSRSLTDVVREVEDLAASGVTEVTLLGQTVNSYHDESHDFADLLRAVGKVDGVRRVRFTSPHPNDFSQPVIDAMAAVPEVCEHVHLPVQSGSSRVLKRMLRRYTRDAYLVCVDRLREAIPQLAITTDIIVGFPGETEEDFLETDSLVRQVQFDDAFTFKYSVRDGTPAVKIKDHVPDEVAGERLERIIGTVRGVARAKNAGLVGTTHEVLVEKRARRGEMLQSRTRTNKVVLIEGTTDLVGSYQRIRLTGTTGSTFTGLPTVAGRELSVIE